MTIFALLIASSLLGYQPNIAPWISHEMTVIYRAKEHSKRAVNAWNRLNFASNGVEIAVENKR